MSEQQPDLETAFYRSALAELASAGDLHHLRHAFYVLKSDRSVRTGLASEAVWGDLLAREQQVIADAAVQRRRGQ